MHGGAKSQGGTSGNAINGINPNNPNAENTGTLAKMNLEIRMQIWLNKE